jgi:hypothetical protein
MPIVNAIESDLDVTWGGTINSSRSSSRTAGFSPGGATLQHNHHNGFDPERHFAMLTVGAPFQMYLSVTGEGAFNRGWDFVLDPPSAPCAKIVSKDMTYSDQNLRGLLVLEGVAPGECQLFLKNEKSKLVDTVKLKVVPARNVVARFYNLIDGKGREGVTVDPVTGQPDAIFQEPRLRQLLDAVNFIVGPQCGVWLLPSNSEALKDASVAPIDLGDHIDNDDKTVQATITTADRDANANYHVYFVWSIKDKPGQKEKTRGSTISNYTLLLASLAHMDRVITLAHEFVHFLSGSHGHDSKNSDLMFETFPHGIQMRRDRLLQIIHV